MSHKQGLKKEIPGQPENITPVHLRPKQIFSTGKSSKRIDDETFKKLWEKARKAEAEAVAGTGESEKKEGTATT